ncbi:MAG TPA: response regulator [Verrucomicrobiae bacterium]
MERIRILIVEDSSPDAELLVNELRAAGFALDAQRVDTETAYRIALASHPDLIFADSALPKFSMYRALSLVRENQFDIPLIVFSGSLDDDSITEHLKNGATDFIPKRQLSRIGPITRRALSEARLRNECRQLNAEFTRLQRIAAATGNFSTGILNEFATLLTVIQGNAEILLSDTTLNDNLRKSIEHIFNGAGRAASLAKRLAPPKSSANIFRS